MEAPDTWSKAQKKHSKILGQVQASTFILLTRLRN